LAPSLAVTRGLIDRDITKRRDEDAACARIDRETELLLWALPFRSNNDLIAVNAESGSPFHVT
jgi:hypothetical protein